MAKNVTARIRNRQIVSRLHAGDEHAIAAAYNQAGDKYEAYADGDLQDPIHQGQYAYGDRRIWPFSMTNCEHYVPKALDRSEFST